MRQVIGSDAHKRYSVFVAVVEDGRCGPERKAPHAAGAFEAFLQALPPGSEIALEASDIFGVREREQLAQPLGKLPPHTRQSVEQQLAGLDFVEGQIGDCERRLAGLLEENEEVRRLRRLPCVGPILSAVLWLEIGEVDGFPDAPYLASYAGLVPRVRASGGHTRLGPVCRDVNHYLKWAFAEAGHLVALNQRRLAACHVHRLYQRLRQRKSHQKAVVAVARHPA